MQLVVLLGEFAEASLQWVDHFPYPKYLYAYIKGDIEVEKILVETNMQDK